MLRERTQRRLFRVLFALGCVLPTLAVAVFAVNRVSPAYQDSLLEQLSRRLGGSIACDRITTPRPGVYQLTGVRAVSPSGAEMAAVAGLRVLRRDGRWQVSGTDARCASASDAAIVLSRLAEAGFDADVRLDRLAIESTAPLSGLSITLSGTAEGARQLTLADQAGRRAQALLDRGVWQLHADTGGQPIPADWLPGEPLAADSANAFNFAGSLRAECSPDGRSVRGVAAGRFEIDGLDLRQLIAARGSLTEVDLRWTHERIEQLSGRLTLRDGQLSRAFVEGAAACLKLKPYEALLSLYNSPLEPLAWFPFTQLACEVELGPQGLLLVARNDQIDGQNRSGQVAHAIVEHEGLPLLGEPTEPNRSVQNLVQAWFSNQQAELPASSEALELARRLPNATQR